jgi:uncharacterized Tic20 family protein
MEHLNSSITQNERVLAAISHASILVPVTGAVIPFIIWSTQKEKSQFVRGHSLQALVYQLSLIVYFVAIASCFLLSLVARSTSITLETLDGKQLLNPLLDISMLFPLLINIVIFLGMFLFTIYGFIGSVRTLQGKPFQYILIGRKVENYIQSKQNVLASK